MAKGEKVKSKPPPPSDISSSDTSDYSSDNVSSDKEIDNITKIWIARPNCSSLG